MVASLNPKEEGLKGCFSVTEFGPIAAAQSLNDNPGCHRPQHGQHTWQLQQPAGGRLLTFVTMARRQLQPPLGAAGSQAGFHSLSRSLVFFFPSFHCSYVTGGERER